MALSVRRALAVKEALVRDGVPDEAMDVWGRGDDALPVAPGDAMREPQHCRVEMLQQIPTSRGLHQRVVQLRGGCQLGRCP